MQSVAVRLVVEREREIKAFVPVEYWTLEAELEGKLAALVHAPGWPSWTGRSAEVSDQAIADGLRRRAAQRSLPGRLGRAARAPAQCPAAVHHLASCSRRRANQLHFTAKKTMTLAQRLYEGVELGDEGAVGLITYMRTDSTRLSDDAVGRRASFIADTYGKEALPDEPVVYKSREVRPGRPRGDPSGLDGVDAGSGDGLPRAGRGSALRR